MDDGDLVDVDAVLGSALGVDVWAREVKLDTSRKAAVQTKRDEV